MELTTQKNRCRLKQTLLSLLLVPLSILPAHAVTLEQAVQQTLQNNPEALAAEANVKARKSAVRQAQADYLPSVSVSLGRGEEYSENPSLEASGIGHTNLSRRENGVVLDQMVFNGLQTQYQVKRNHYQYQSAQSLLSDNYNTLAQQAIEAFLNILRYRELVRLAEQNVVIHQNTLEKVQQRYDTKVGTIVELELAKSRLSRAKAELTAQVGEYQIAQARYLAVVGTPAPAILEQPITPMSMLPATLNEALSTAYRYNPALQVSENDYLASKANIGTAQANFYPHFDVLLAGNKNDNIDGLQGKNNDASAMVTMSYNIFRGGGDRAAVNTAKSETIRDQKLVDQTARTVMENTKTTWAELTAEKKRVIQLAAYVNHTTQVVAGYKKQFTLGKRALFNLLDEENELFNARTDHTNARYNMYVGVYQLLADMGLLNHVLFNTPLPERAIPMPPQTALATTTEPNRATTQTPSNSAAHSSAAPKAAQATTAKSNAATTSASQPALPHTSLPKPTSTV